jgi:Mn2+/Fe2+ NRAMP family transporter
MRAKIAVSSFLSIAVVVVLLSLSFRIGSSTGKETASRYSERAWVDLEVGEVGGEMKV